MASPEDKFVTELSQALSAYHGCDVRNMHGNMYQSGIPDRLVIRPSRNDFCFVETKVLNLKSGIHYDQVQAALRPEQRKNIAIWAHRHGCRDNLYVAVRNLATGGHCVLRGCDLPSLMVKALHVPVHEVDLADVARVIALGGIV